MSQIPPHRLPPSHCYRAVCDYCRSLVDPAKSMCLNCGAPQRPVQLVKAQADPHRAYLKAGVLSLNEVRQLSPVWL